MKVGDLMGPGDDDSLSPAQNVERKRNWKKVRRRILSEVTRRVKEDVDAYVRDNEDTIIFTVANGGGFAIGINAYLPDSRTPSEAMADSAAEAEQLVLVSAEEEPAEVAEKREAVMEAVERELDRDE